jgi:peptidoglycan/LPS O-acetylase OafA/YrhL
VARWVGKRRDDSRRGRHECPRHKATPPQRGGPLIQKNYFCGSQLPQLDFVRSVAVLLVLFGHLIHTLGFQHLGSAAHFGVLLFFVHTCLVLFMSMERLHSNGGLFIRFYLRRAFRIYPLSILAVCTVVAFHIPPNTWQGPYVFPGINTIAANITLVQNVTGDPSILSPLWSLPLEVQMYAVLPFLFVLYTRHSVRASIIWLGAFIAAAMFSLWPAAGNLVLYAPSFCAGIVAYDLARREPAWSFQVLALGLGILLFAFVSVARFTPLLVTDSAVTILAGIVIGRSGPPSSAIMRVGSHVIAKYSYGIYLAHLPLMWLCFHHGHEVGGFVLFAIAIVIVPFLLYHAIEAPMIRLGQRISNRIARRPALWGRTVSYVTYLRHMPRDRESVPQRLKPRNRAGSVSALMIGRK